MPACAGKTVRGYGRFLLSRWRLARRETGVWIPACAGKTVRGYGRFLLCQWRLVRRETGVWIPACAGKTVRGCGSSCFLGGGWREGGRGFGFPPARERRCVDAAVPAFSVEVGATGDGGLDSRLRGKDGMWMRRFLLPRRRLARRETGVWIPACAGKTVRGCGRFLLCRWRLARRETGVWREGGW